LLEYVDSTTIKLKAVSTDVDVVFPNLDSVTVTTAGITKTVTGSTTTLYYVYLTTAGELDISTNAPTDVYSNIQFYGETNILVGWLGCSASNTIAGNHNVFSFWNQDTQTWSKSITSATTTLILNGLVVPPNVTATISRSGSTTYRFTLGGWPLYNISSYSRDISTTDGTVDSGVINPYDTPSCASTGANMSAIVGSVTNSYSSTSFSTGVYNASISLTYSIYSSFAYGWRWLEMIGGGGGSTTFLSASGNLTLTRPGS
jgi:hypothetical protein